MKTDKPNYNVPDGYFEDFQDRLATQLAFEKIVGTKSDAGFRVPEGYFSTLSRKLHHIPAKQETKVVRLFSKRILWAIASIAAAIAIVFIILPMQNQTSLESIEDESIATYLEEEITGFSSYDIADLFSDEQINELALNETSEEADILEYLDTYTDQYDLIVE